MKPIVLKSVMLVLLTLFSFSTHAYDAEIDGISYDLKTEEKQAIVGFASVPPSGAVNIPASIEYDGVTYDVTSIGEGAFASCLGLITITIPNSVTSIGNYAFYNCEELVEVTIPNGVTNIGNRAFYGCSSLSSIHIPHNVVHIGEWAFYYCRRLTSVMSEIEEPFALGERYMAFSNISSNCTLIVPKGLKESYIAQGWTESVFKGGIIEANSPLKCATPTITLADGKLVFYCETEGVEYVVNCIPNINCTLTGNELNLSEAVSFTVWVYATAPNHEDSETVTETFTWPMDSEGDLNGDGYVNISDVTKLVNMILGKE